MPGLLSGNWLAVTGRWLTESTVGPSGPWSQPSLPPGEAATPGRPQRPKKPLGVRPPLSTGMSGISPLTSVPWRLLAVNSPLETNAQMSKWLQLPCSWNSS